MTPSRSAFLIFVGVLVSAPTPAAPERFPYRLAVEVVYQAAGSGPETAREQLQEAIETALQHRGCFRTVAPLDPERVGRSDLLLSVTVGTVVDETEYTVSMAQRTSADATPEAAARPVARFGARISLALLTLPARGKVRDRRFLAEVRHEPLDDEDPRVMAREQMIDDVSHHAASWACKGSVKGLDRRIERANEAAASR